MQAQQTQWLMPGNVSDHEARPRRWKASADARCWKPYSKHPMMDLMSTRSPPAPWHSECLPANRYQQVSKHAGCSGRVALLGQTVVPGVLLPCIRQLMARPMRLDSEAWTLQLEGHLTLPARGLCIRAVLRAQTATATVQDRSATQSCSRAVLGSSGFHAVTYCVGGRCSGAWPAARTGSQAAPGTLSCIEGMHSLHYVRGMTAACMSRSCKGEHSQCCQSWKVQPRKHVRVGSHHALTMSTYPMHIPGTGLNNQGNLAAISRTADGEPASHACIS